MLLCIKQWESKKIRDFAVVKNGEITEEQLYKKLIAMYYSYVSENGIEPFVLVYGRTHGFCVNTNSYVGAIVYDDVVLYISSIIPELSLGKILYLQSQSQNENNDTTTKRVITDYLNDEETIAAVDYFIVSLVNIFEDIKQNGLLTELQPIRGEKNKPIGKLLLPKQVSRYPAYDKYLVEKTINTPNMFINRIIRTAFEKAKSLTSLDWIIPIITDAISFMDTVESITELDPNDFPKISDYTSIKRDDYEKAIRLSKFILFGYDPLEGDSASFFPEFMLDMNVIFEYYVTAELEKIFKSGFECKKIFSLGFGPVDIPIDRKNIELDGYYRREKNVIVLDAKNKYKSVLDKDIPDFIASNPDIYQQYYYASRVNAKQIILVYPSRKKHNSPIGEYDLNFPNNKAVKLYLWALRITGTPRENKTALINLARFIESLD